MRPFFLYPYRIQRESPEELPAAREIFGDAYVSTNARHIPAGALVVPRFRMLPFGRELQEEVESQGARLVNSYREHRAVADIFTYAPQFVEAGLTAPCYRLEDLHTLPEGEYFLKGETNSLKDAWFTAAYAHSKRAALDVASRLSQDLVTAGQQVVVRPFQHYRQLTTGIDGRPIFHERRVFAYRGRLLSQGFYWTGYFQEVGLTEALDEDAYQETLGCALALTKDLCPLVVIDLAECPDGSWGVVELNDGAMAGLSMNDPRELWENFLQAVKEEQGLL